MSRRVLPSKTWSETVDRAQKEKVVEELGQIFESSGVVVVAHYEGMTVAEMQDLRAKMRDAGGSVRVAKNKLAKIALEGQPCASIADYLTGMTVLSYSEDPVAAAKVVLERMLGKVGEDPDAGVPIDIPAMETPADESPNESPSHGSMTWAIAGSASAPSASDVIVMPSCAPER